MPEKEKTPAIRYLCRTDLYYLLRYVLHRPDVENQWIFDRCREIQNNPNGYLDLWAREHYKSTIITFAKTIQDILASHGDDPLPEWGGREATFGIFSFNRPGAKKFVGQIKDELETNKDLIALFPDVLYESPQRDAKSWSLDTGLVVRRRANPKEATVEGNGLVDSMPTGAHYLIRVYDDVITEKFCRSPEMIAKTTESWELSLNLGARGGYSRYIGTRYHTNDTYRPILDRKAAKPRIYAATHDGTVEGEPIYLTREELAEKRRTFGPYTFACQMLQNPVADEVQGFRREWIRYHDGTDGAGMNIYLLCDPAGEKKKNNDYTAIMVIGLGPDKNYYLLDMVYDRLNLGERTRKIMEMHRKWRPKKVGYEKYGKDSDIEHIKYVQGDMNYRFDINPLGGGVAKNDRIKRLIPIFEQGRFYIPQTIFYTNYEKKTEDLISKLLNEEYDPFPVPVHDDGLDCMARILDEDFEAMWPMTLESEDRYSSMPRRRGSAWAM